jgi:hypothetical protein
VPPHGAKLLEPSLRLEDVRIHHVHTHVDGRVGAGLFPGGRGVGGFLAARASGPKTPARLARVPGAGGGLGGAGRGVSEWVVCVCACVLMLLRSVYMLKCTTAEYKKGAVSECVCVYG